MAAARQDPAAVVATIMVVAIVVVAFIVWGVALWLWWEYKARRGE